MFLNSVLPHLCTLGRLRLCAQHDCCCEKYYRQCDCLSVAEVVSDLADDMEELLITHFFMSANATDLAAIISFAKDSASAFVLTFVPNAIAMAAAMMSLLLIVVGE